MDQVIRKSKVPICHSSRTRFPKKEKKELHEIVNRSIRKQEGTYTNIVRYAPILSLLSCDSFGGSSSVMNCLPLVWLTKFVGGTWASLISFNKLIIALRRHYSRQPTLAGVRAQVAARTTLSTASVAALKFPFPNSWKRRHNIFCIFPIIIYKEHILNESIYSIKNRNNS